MIVLVLQRMSSLNLHQKTWLPFSSWKIDKEKSSFLINSEICMSISIKIQINLMQLSRHLSKVKIAQEFNLKFL